MSLLLSHVDLDRLFPAHIQVNGRGQVVRVGAALQRRLGIDCLPIDLLDLVRIERPRRIETFEDLRRIAGTIMISVPSAGAVRLKGTVLCSGEETYLLVSFALDTKVREPAAALRFDDFAETDSAVELLLTVELQRNLLRETEILIADLKAARAAADLANQAKTKFLADGSHEIRNPLNGIVGVADLMAQQELPTSVSRNVEMIRSSGLTLERLLTDLLDVAKAEAGMLDLLIEPFEVMEEVRHAVGAIGARALAKGLQFSVETIGEAPIWVEGDAARVKQIVSNLASNAVKFTEVGSVTVLVCQEAERLVIQIEDTGPGMSADVAARLFSRFVQADGMIAQRYGGSGLGLSICWELAQLMGGDLSVSTEPGFGTRFQFVMPGKRVEARPASQDIAQSTDSGESLRAFGAILVVDDHEVNREVARQMLAGLNAELVFASSGEEALNVWQKRELHLILMDMRMPGIGGLEATRRLRASEAAAGRPRTRIMILSADASSADRQASLLAGADHHLSKPVRPASLLAAIVGVADQ